VLILKTDTGNLGYGEAPATAVITGDTHGSILDALRFHIIPPLLGMDITQITQITQTIQQAIVHNTNAKAAAEIAVYDLYAQERGLPLYKVLGHKVVDGGEPYLRTDLTISVDRIEKMVTDSLLAIEAGYGFLKLKVGTDITLDIKRVHAIYEAVEGRARLLLDVNQGWTAEQTVTAFQKLENAGVKLELIEQPVKTDDLNGMVFITQRVNTPVMADESAFSAQQVVEILERCAADIINIKLMKAGGITSAITIADIAETYGVPCMIGCMLETSISVAAAAHFAVSRAHVITYVDLDGPALGTFNPVKGGTQFNGPNIHLNDTPGLGITSIKGLTTINGE
jgi:L-alanine-DL-glutamate epimerase-like enolase superfamily enzyme